MLYLEIHNNVTEAQKNLKAGDRVLVTRDNGDVEIHEVRYPPKILSGGHTWVVWLEGIRGCCALCRVQPIPEGEPQ